MPLITRHLAPAGSPIGLSDILNSLGSIFAGAIPLKRLSDELINRYGTQYCLFVTTGRAAFTLILRALIRISNNPLRNEVILPSYTCYSVAASIINAGLIPRICDIDPDTLTYSRTALDSIDTSRVLAITTSSLYGIPDELHHIEHFSRSNGLFFIDDAAQSLHAKLRGRYVGTFGDVGLISFDKGKNITSLHGGAILTNNQAIAAHLSELINTLPLRGTSKILADIAQLTVYSAFLNPYLYGIPNSIPWLGLGQTPFRTDVDFEQYHPSLATVAHRLLCNVDSITNQRISVAARLSRNLSGHDAIQFITPPVDSTSVYSRFPLLLKDASSADQVCATLRAHGIGASRSYPTAIADIPALSGFDTVTSSLSRGGRNVAGRILTLPTHFHVTDKDIELMSCLILRNTA